MAGCVLGWSGGKDGMMALHHLKNDGRQTIIELFTTLSQKYRRVTMHGIRETLLENQAESLGLPLIKMFLHESPDMARYNRQMQELYSTCYNRGIDHVAFGDIFLQDLRNYRERQVEKASLRAIFPLWGKPSEAVIKSFIDLGYEARVVAINGSKLPAEFAGRSVDYEFLRDLPSDVDPCGENGEFHTFVTNGPLFSHPIDVIPGDMVERQYPSPVNKEEVITYYFQELLPG